MIRLGYACINLTLGLTTSRTLRLANLGDTEKVRRLVDANLAALARILPWNAHHNWPLFRIGQQLVPFASHPDYPYDWQAAHVSQFKDLGQQARDLGLRLSMHPGQYVNPGSPDPAVVRRSLAELRYAARVLSLLDTSHSVLVLHLGGVYDDRPATLDRFVQTLQPEDEIRQYLALENDERCWSPPQVLQAARRLHVPAILDNLHHRLNPGGLSYQEALDAALPTWNHHPPKLHLSSQAPDKKPGAHSDTIHPDDAHALRRALAGRPADVMIEAKAKEQALPHNLKHRLEEQQGP